MKPLHRWILPNGLTVLYRQSEGVPLSAATLLLRTGSVYEIPDQAGLANLTTEVLTQGTKHRSAQRLAEEIESMGASLGAQASDDYSELGFVAPVTHLDRILDILADILMHPTFSQSELHKERSHVLASLKSRKDSLFNVALDALNADLFGTAHPYGRPIDGLENTVRRFHREDLHNWHQKHFHPDRAIFSLISSLPLAQAQAKIERQLKNWKKTTPFDAPIALPPVLIAKNRRRSLQAQFEQAYLMMGVPAPGVLDTDYLTLKVLNTVLGGGMSSRLFLRLREDLGLAYEVSSFFPTHWVTSEWVVYLGLPPEKLLMARKELGKILTTLRRRAPAREEVAQAIAMIKGSYLMEHQTRRRQAWYAAWWEFLGKGREYDQHFLAEVEAITPAQVGALARRLLSQPSITVEITPRQRK